MDLMSTIVESHVEVGDPGLSAHVVFGCGYLQKLFSHGVVDALVHQIARVIDERARFQVRTL